MATEGVGLDELERQTVPVHQLFRRRADGSSYKGYRMVKWHRSPSLCLETAVHYEHQAERAADPVARQKFLDLAFEWRRSALIYESLEEVSIVPSEENCDSEGIGLHSLSSG
jgi:hypothetical protein